MTEPYCYDFPELISPPAKNYGNTLVFQGQEREEATIRLVQLDLIVKSIVDVTQDSNSLGCTAPEQINAPRILDEIGYLLPDEINVELLACINKVVRILRREMEPNEIWHKNQLLTE